MWYINYDKDLPDCASPGKRRAGLVFAGCLQPMYDFVAAREATRQALKDVREYLEKVSFHNEFLK